MCDIWIGSSTSKTSLDSNDLTKLPHRNYYESPSLSVLFLKVFMIISGKPSDFYVEKLKFLSFEMIKCSYTHMILNSSYSIEESWKLWFINVTFEANQNVSLLPLLIKIRESRFARMKNAFSSITYAFALSIRDWLHWKSLKVNFMFSRITLEIENSVLLTMLSILVTTSTAMPAHLALPISCRTVWQSKLTKKHFQITKTQTFESSI